MAFRGHFLWHQLNRNNFYRLSSNTDYHLAIVEFFVRLPFHPPLSWKRQISVSRGFTSYQNRPPAERWHI